MKNKRQRDEDERDRADPLCKFLGGDDMALRIFRALISEPFVPIDTVDKLRSQYRDLYPGAVNRIGPVALARIREKFGESG